LSISPLLNGAPALHSPASAGFAASHCAALRERVIFRIGSGIYR
jgi:hypothetical protein